jgi:hypothetical protein
VFQYFFVWHSPMSDLRETMIMKLDQRLHNCATPRQDKPYINTRYTRRNTIDSVEYLCVSKINDTNYIRALLISEASLISLLTIIRGWVPYWNLFFSTQLCCIDFWIVSICCLKMSKKIRLSKKVASSLNNHRII